MSCILIEMRNLILTAKISWQKLLYIYFNFTNILFAAENRNEHANTNRNQIVKKTVGIILGPGLTSAAQVSANRLNHNKVYSDNMNILFADDTHNNNAKFNAYSSTVRPVIDSGTANLH